MKQYSPFQYFIRCARILSLVLMQRNLMLLKILMPLCSSQLYDMQSNCRKDPEKKRSIQVQVSNRNFLPL